MPARDDSVIRGSMITSLILLVISLIVNFLLWSSGDETAGKLADEKTKVASSANQIRDQNRKIETLSKMVGGTSWNTGEVDTLSTTSSGDEKIDGMSKIFVQDMGLLSKLKPSAVQNYQTALSELRGAYTTQSRLLSASQDRQKQLEDEKKRDVAAARAAQKLAEDDRDEKVKELKIETDKFAVDREAMLKKQEEAKDAMNRSKRDFDILRNQNAAELKKRDNRIALLESTIESQRLELQRLRVGQFETVQGEIRYIQSGGTLVSINLGSADALRPGITFGVVDRDDTARLADAKVKASIQITKILDAHLAEARVIARPEIGDPIIAGDSVYSPFWAPGRTVKIALAGPIDLDGDGRPDNEPLKGMILDAGAEVVDNGARSGFLDPSVRFLVVGEASLGGPNEDLAADAVRAVGEAKQRAIESGVTIIPGWKLQGYLQNMSDSVTTPFGSASNAADFAPMRSNAINRRPTNLPKLFLNQRDNVQRTNQIVRP
ncbi:hypothetical protein SV7mr_36250 [Stieleria bergensis]|uniref:Uncharacterized protein n=1 Tax=Stieleria bergensis TaxID=2528025 RepID=A0A517SY69_9BACT|nr:hypothetical protein SV7mr_36250 [Planctomycetes bacterium SV_7m_r]